MTRPADQLLADASAWWDTSIIDIHPGKIAIRGYPVEQLIGRVRFPEMIWLMLRGELPAPEQAELLEAALVPGVDHGPHARQSLAGCLPHCYDLRTSLCSRARDPATSSGMMTHY